MKTRVLLVLSLMLVKIPARGQGTVLFANLGPGVDAPVTNAAGHRIIGPAPYVADLFWSSDTNAPVDSLSGVGFNVPFSTSTLSGGGYFIGATRTVPSTQWFLAQVRVWDASQGGSYAQARDHGGEFGSSNPILIFPGFPPGPATPLVGLQGFQLGRIPEPSAAGLAFIGVAALWLFRRARK